MREKRCEGKSEFREKSFLMTRRKITGKTEGTKNPKLLYSVNSRTPNRGSPQAQEARSLYRCFALCLTLKYLKLSVHILPGTFKLCSPSHLSAEENQSLPRSLLLHSFPSRCTTRLNQHSDEIQTCVWFHMLYRAQSG